jgi:hypothetical protein
MRQPRSRRGNPWILPRISKSSPESAGSGNMLAVGRP